MGIIEKNIEAYRDILVNVSAEFDLLVSIIHSPVFVWDWYLLCHFALPCKSSDACSKMLHREDPRYKTDNFSNYRDKSHIFKCLKT